jgi:hypothetical protein
MQHADLPSTPTTTRSAHTPLTPGHASSRQPEGRAASGPPGAFYWAAIACAFLVATGVRVVNFLEPWVGSHNAWGGAFYSNVARNFVRYGFQTKLAPVVSTGVVDPSQFEVYYHHPVLSMLVTSVAFRVFGEHEWSARLAPLLFSLLTLALVFRMARRWFGNATALVALAIMAVLPVDAYYATHLDPYGSMAIFFTVLAVDAYERWHADGRSRHLVIGIAAVALGCMTSWFTYLVVPGIVVHWFLTRRSGARRADWVRIAAFPATTIAVFALFLLHRRAALTGTGPEVYDQLGDRLLMRTVELPFSRLEILDTYFWHIRDFYTLAFVGLMVAWVALFAFAAWRRRLSTGDACVAILLSFGALYALAFPGHLPSHDYFVRAYVPGVALGAAVVITRLADVVPRPGLRPVVTAAVLLFLAGVSLARVRAQYLGDNREFAPRFIGYARAIAAITTPRDRVLMPGRGDRIMEYYVDRAFTYELDSPAKMDSALTAAAPGTVVAVPHRDSLRFPEVLAALRARLPEHRAGGLHLFRRARDGN